jgi:hypothetical protein
MVDARKICFIYCANNEQLLSESMRSVGELHVPGGYTVEIKIIRKATGMAKGYNEAMKCSDAKYKVYLHQDILVLNRNFLKEMVMLFLKHPKLGLLGVGGAKQLPPDAYWPHAKDCYGLFLWGDLNQAVPFAWNQVAGDYEPVQVIDGVAMVTQYDLPWREDIFQGWHFYDISQSLEFIKAGYDVGIPRQTAPWFLHRSHEVSMAGYDEARRLFQLHYGNCLDR